MFVYLSLSLSLSLSFSLYTCMYTLYDRCAEHACSSPPPRAREVRKKGRSERSVTIHRLLVAPENTIDTMLQAP